MKAPVISFLSSLLTTAFLIRVQSLDSRAVGLSTNLRKHKFLRLVAYKVGGICILTGLVLGTTVCYLQDPGAGIFIFRITACSLIAFMLGFTNDISRASGPIPRILMLVVCSFSLAISFNSGLPILALEL